IFAKPVQQAVKNKQVGQTFLYLAAGIIVGGLARFAGHFAAGWFFFGDAAPEGQSTALYSFIYNSTYMFPSLIICLVDLFILFYYTIDDDFSLCPIHFIIQATT